MSNHKCRYCINANMIDEDLAYCSVNNDTKDKRQCTRENKCKDFDFCEIDVFDLDKKYKPRPKKYIGFKQINMFEEK